MTLETPRRSLRWYQVAWRQLPIFLALVALWLFLWDSVTVMTLATGILIALVVPRVLYLPPVLFSGRLNPWRALVLGVRMIVDVTRASVQIAWYAVDPRWKPSNAILAVQLHTRSDVVMTLTAEAISVVPGTVVVDIDRERGVLYLHAIGTRTEADVEHVRRGVIGTEERIVLAVGSHEEAELIRAERRLRRAHGEHASPDGLGSPLPPGADGPTKEDDR